MKRVLNKSNEPYFIDQITFIITLIVKQKSMSARCGLTLLPLCIQNKGLLETTVGCLQPGQGYEGRVVGHRAETSGVTGFNGSTRQGKKFQTIQWHVLSEVLGGIELSGNLV